ncbi:MAG: DUF4397 domain-containing protein [Planctomycetes bacterium]|nr:DUF4397 domain-containing protein [Planctomycetota bacterium]
MKSLLFGSFLALATASTALAQDPRLTVIHGISGLPAPVEVFANGGRLFSFDFGQSRGPLVLSPATYAIEVKLNGQTVLSANPSLAAGKDYTAIAHFRPVTGITLSLYENDIGDLPRGQARLSVRHTAQAPAVDVGLDQNGQRVATLQGLANPGEAKSDIANGAYRATIFPAGSGSAVFGPADLVLQSRVHTIVYAIGSLAGGTFRLFVQSIDLNPVSFAAEGVACGASRIASSVSNPELGETFEFVLDGARPNVPGMLLVGVSSTRLGGLVLPLDLGYLGATGCTLYTSGEVMLPLTTDGAGRATYRAAAPGFLAGTRGSAYAQFIHMAQGANPFGMQLSNGLAIRFR